jgi:tetratricopeptide (TPR) repeat protein
MRTGWLLGLIFTIAFGIPRQAQGQGAIRLYNDALEHYMSDEYDQAEERVRLALKIQKLYPDAWFLLGQCYRRRDQFRKSIRFYKKALKQTPTNAEFLYHKALAYEEWGKLKKAVKTYGETTAVDPNYTLAWKRLGAIFFVAGDFRTAIDNYTRAVDSNPLDEDNFLQRGNAQLALGNNSEAIHDFDLTLALDAENADAYFNRASARFASGDPYDAVKDFSMVIDRRPEERDAWLNRGISLLALELYPQALSDFREALRLDSAFADTWWNIAYLQLELDSIEPARTAIYQATRLSPGDAEAWLLQGRIEFGQRNYDAAIKAYDRCLGLDPRYAEAYLNRGEAKRVKGDEKAACKDWKKVLKYDAVDGVHAEKAGKWIQIICE